jgi:predicted nucleic acid-binding protein
MTEAISDTGPLLHLHEVDQWPALRVFEHVLIPDLVAEELRLYLLDPAQLIATGIHITIVAVDRDDWTVILNESNPPTIHSADAQVAVLARQHAYRLPILTDDLSLRKLLEKQGALVIGTIGVLVRAYTAGHLTRLELNGAVEALFTVSTLHLGRAFRAYVQQLLANL